MRREARPAIRLGAKRHLSALTLILVFALAWLSCSTEKKNPGTRNQSRDYSALIKTEVAELRAMSGETTDIHLQLKNQGKKEWSSAGANPCFVSYHLLSENKNLLRFDNPRTPLGDVIWPGQKAEVIVRVKAPLDKGRYLLEFDLLREGIAWFKDYGGGTLEIPLLAEELRYPEDTHQPDLAYGRFTNFRSSLPELDKLRRLIRVTLQHDAVEFPGKTGIIAGFTAGAGYPQVWLRDSATIIPASRYYYPESFLTSWLEEHLAFQKADGGLQDWIDAGGRSDKNTVETDQEASAVQSAFQVFILKGSNGPTWLQKKVAGEAIIDRLEKALHFPFSRRYSEKYGLITGAHTADWGDVDPEDADQNAIYVDEKTHWTSDIYDQAMAFEACREMAEMLNVLNRRDKADFWEKKADSLRKNANRWLWQDERGFYRMHVHLDSWQHNFDEDDMFAMGGNAQAVISGLADIRQAKKIIEQALARQKRFSLSTISGSLLPPYPRGFFKHPAMDEPFEYQNGGQWDWFGGRLIYAMFENGCSGEAGEKLTEVIRKDVANAGLYEWDAQDGSGRGSDYYGGSAGSLAKAMFEGLFGIELTPQGIILRPELGEASATVHVYLPTADIFAAYDYQPLMGERKIIFRYNSNDPRPGKVKILVPRPFFRLTDGDQIEKKLEVFRDGASVAFEWQNLYSDDFIVVDTDFKNHTLEIKQAQNMNVSGNH
jgi:hypothetical protein